jgi:sugar/nucleoside kinase (ribokinase family)
MTRRGILTGGTLCVDHNKLVDIWPGENGRADIIDAQASGGAPTFNMAINMRKLDPAMPVAMIGVVGDDPDGRLILDEVDSFGIDRSQVAIIGGAVTNYTDAFCSQATGRRTHISYYGVGNLLTPDHFDFSRSNHRIVHLGLPGIHRMMDGAWAGEANGWVAILKKARAASLETNLELPSIAADRLAAIVRPCLPHLDYLIVNDSEIGGIAGMETVREGRTDVAVCGEAAAAALRLGVGQLVAVHFPEGGIVVTRDGAVSKLPSVNLPESEIVGANGAGDAFAAGLLYGIHEGWAADDALTLAHATAAASLRQMSTTGAVEAWRTCLDLASRWGWRNAIS